MKIKLSQPFASNGNVDEFDVKQLKKALNRLGYYQPYEKVGITGMADAGVFDALKAFQKNYGLKPTGTARPDDETIQALNKEASKTPAGQYIWRTVEDEKVRKGHAEFNRTVRDWGNSPDPGEEFNCRCWAEPATQKQIDKKKKQKCFADLPWEEEAKNNIKGHEKDYEFPYVDTELKITVGYGINIDKTGVFIGLSWKTKSKNGPDATKKEKEDGYQSLRDHAARNVGKNGKLNIKADSQKNWSGLYLPDDIRDGLFEDFFSDFLNALTGKFSDIDCFPPPAKVALMDMIFNLGATKFTRTKWPALFKAVNQRDWEIAAEECHRLDVHEKRNIATRNFFIKAAEMEEQSQ